MEKRKYLYLLLPVLILLTISCTCGAPGLRDFLPQQEEESPAAPVATVPVQNKDPQLPTAAAAPADQPQAAEMQEIAISNTNRFTSGDWRYVVGEITNNLAVALDYVDVSMILYDANNQILATESVSPLMTPLFPGDVSPFVVSSDSWGEFDHFEFVINDWYESDNASMPDLQIISHSSYSDDYTLTIVGEIYNNSEQPANWVYVTGSLYDGSGLLLNATTAYSMLDVINPGERAPFKLYFSDNWQDSTDYYIQLTGSSTDPVEPTVRLVDYSASQSGGSCEFSGTIENLTSEEIGFATIVVNMYDANDQLIDANWTFSDGDTIAPNAQDTFTLSVYDCKGYDHEVVKVE